MSGRLPPTGPRALQTSVASTSSTHASSSYLTTQSPRLNGTSPVAARTLQAGSIVMRNGTGSPQKAIPTGPSALNGKARVPRAKPTAVDSFFKSAGSKSRLNDLMDTRPPTDPSSFNDTAQPPTSSPPPEPPTPSLSGELPSPSATSRIKIVLGTRLNGKPGSSQHISLQSLSQTPPPEPASEPPPPPPPTSAPPLPSNTAAPAHPPPPSAPAPSPPPPPPPGPISIAFPKKQPAPRINGFDLVSHTSNAESTSFQDTPTASPPPIKLSPSVATSVKPIPQPTAGPSRLDPIPPPPKSLTPVPPSPKPNVRIALPEWPLPPSSYPNKTPSYKCIYDPMIDRNPSVMDVVRLNGGSIEGDYARITGKKGKEMCLRFGETVQGEEPLQVGDPRKQEGYKPKQRRFRSDLVQVEYEYDGDSVGPPPATAVLITRLSPLHSQANVRKHFGVYGNILNFEPQIDPATGGALGVVWIKFNSHETALRCVEKEHGNRLGGPGGLGIGGLNLPVGSKSGEEINVVLDGEGKKAKGIIKELLNQRQAAKKKEKEAKEAAARARSPSSLAKHTTSTPDPSRPLISSQSASAHPSLPQNPIASTSSSVPTSTPVDTRLVAARLRSERPESRSGSRRDHERHYRPSYNGINSPMLSDSSTPTHYRRSSRSPSPAYKRYRRVSRSPSPTHRQYRRFSRSPSPVHRHYRRPPSPPRTTNASRLAELLAENGYPYVAIEGSVDGLREDDVRRHFDGFPVEDIFRPQDQRSFVITFRTKDAAQRAFRVLNGESLARRAVNMSYRDAALKNTVQQWTKEEMVKQAEEKIIKDLRETLSKDIIERHLSKHIRSVVAEERVRKTGGKSAAPTATNAPTGSAQTLKSLSFKKPSRKRNHDDLSYHQGFSSSPARPSTEDLIEDENIAAPDPKPRVIPTPPPVKKPSRKRPPVKENPPDGVSSTPIESEDDEDTLVTDQVSVVDLKRISPEDQDSDVGLPPKKRLKAIPDVPPPSQVVLVEPTKRGPTFVPRPSSPTPDIFAAGICLDDEDAYYAKLAISGYELPAEQSKDDTPKEEVGKRVHASGSARTEGYYKISHAEKAAYVAQYTVRAAAATEEIAVVETTQPQHVTSSRSNRANARRRAQGLEEMNQVQRAVALSKGDPGVEMTVKFNQLQTRKKHLRFARSPIHAWGLYAMERIARGEMVIEYVGEVIRAQVADKREKAYERQGIGSSYLFRIDEDLVVDATMKGNLGRLINHACDPNCTAKIITINGEKKIVIYAKRDIELGDEILYDYHFPIEVDKIPCLCGSSKCRGYLN